jgi:hypothetical protein
MMSRRNILLISLHQCTRPLTLKPGNSYWVGSISTVHLLVLTSLDQWIFKLKILFTLLQTSYLNEEVNCTELSPSVSFPCSNNSFYFISFLSMLKVYSTTTTCILLLSLVGPTLSIVYSQPQSSALPPSASVISSPWPSTYWTAQTPLIY